MHTLFECLILSTLDYSLFLSCALKRSHVKYTMDRLCEVMACKKWGAVNNILNEQNIIGPAVRDLAASFRLMHEAD